MEDHRSHSKLVPSSRRRSAEADADYAGEGKKNGTPSLKSDECKAAAGTAVTGGWTGEKKTKIQHTPSSGNIGKVVKDDDGQSSGKVVQEQEEGPELLEGLDWGPDELHEKIDCFVQQLKLQWKSRNELHEFVIGDRSALDGEYEDWEDHRNACSTLEGDQEFVWLWDKLLSNTKLIESLLTDSSYEIERVVFYHALKIAAGLSHVYESLIHSGFNMTFKEALKAVYCEGKYTFGSFEWKPEFESDDPHPGVYERLYNTHLGPIDEKVLRDNISEALYMKQGRPPAAPQPCVFFAGRQEPAMAWLLLVEHYTVPVLPHVPAHQDDVALEAAAHASSLAGGSVNTNLALVHDPWPSVPLAPTTCTSNQSAGLRGDPLPSTTPPWTTACTAPLDDIAHDTLDIVAMDDDGRRTPKLVRSRGQW
nr:unnamed protein product [Digitaria exilis]